PGPERRGLAGAARRPEHGGAGVGRPGPGAVGRGVVHDEDGRGGADGPEPRNDASDRRCLVERRDDRGQAHSGQAAGVSTRAAWPPPRATPWTSTAPRPPTPP